MLNRDINSRFSDWLLNPTEALDFEVKQWLDMEDQESRGTVAKALIALENHGGGFLLFGYKEDENKRLIPDSNRPASMEPYLSDAINAILKKRAEPVFHVNVTLQKHPKTGEEYPLVQVPGTSKVPVRSYGGTPKGSLKDFIYYIRASGPESRGPANASEWDALLHRAVLNQREEIIRVLRSVLPAENVATPMKSLIDDEALEGFVETSKGFWKSHNDNLPQEHPARIKLGYYIFSAKLLGKTKNKNAVEIRTANEQARSYTGWPMFITLHDSDIKPKMANDCIEAWTANCRVPSVDFADFWRISPDGYFFIIRGYQEDSHLNQSLYDQPGTYFESSIPIWRVGEFLLRVAELGSFMYEDGFEILARCEWTGLKGRKLVSANGRRWLPPTSSQQDVVVTSGRFPGTISEILPEAVKKLTLRLYEKFDFTQPSDSMYLEELADMTNRKK